jgi:hypothetical protein
MGKWGAAVLAAGSVLLGACDGGGFVVSPSGVLIVGGVTASLHTSLDPWRTPGAPRGTAAAGYACGSWYQPDYIYVYVTSHSTLDLDEVTIQLMDGSNRGGPMLTVPRAGLTQQFSTVRITAGRGRTFGFRSTLPCAAAKPYAVTAYLNVSNEQGAAYRITAQGAFP